VVNAAKAKRICGEGFPKDSAFIIIHPIVFKRIMMKLITAISIPKRLKIGLGGIQDRFDLINPTLPIFSLQK
jgi:hypothetical protein